MSQRERARRRAVKAAPAEKVDFKVEEIAVVCIIEGFNAKGQKVSKQQAQPIVFLRSQQPDVWAAVDELLRSTVRQQQSPAESPTK